MRLTHFDYIKLVKAAYKKKQANNDQPLLAKSTPANIRRECLNVYEERYQKKDEQTLRAFFGPAEEGRQFLQLIRDFKTSRFKPLDKYLKGDTEITSDANLNLLAWLIDFKHRPYVFDNDVQISKEELAIINEPDETIDIIEGEVLKIKEVEEEPFLKGRAQGEPGEDFNERPTSAMSVPEKATRYPKYKSVLITLLLLVIVGGGIFVIIAANSDADCGYWADDHYEVVPCDEESNGRRIIALNEKGMKDLRKITREDTITERSIGRLYYIQNSKDVEYYTNAGKYPEDLNRSLRKLSRLIYEKDSVNRNSIK